MDPFSQSITTAMRALLMPTQLVSWVSCVDTVAAHLSVVYMQGVVETQVKLFTTVMNQGRFAHGTLFTHKYNRGNGTVNTTNLPPPPRTQATRGFSEGVRGHSDVLLDGASGDAPLAIRTPSIKEHRRTARNGREHPKGTSHMWLHGSRLGTLKKAIFS
jgi:hypothetical protein